MTKKEKRSEQQVGHSRNQMPNKYTMFFIKKEKKDQKFQETDTLSDYRQVNSHATLICQGEASKISMNLILTEVMG